MTGGSLSFSSLIGTNFTNAKLIGAYLGSADMFLTDFTGANLTGADLEDAYMEEVIFCNTIMPDGSLRTDNV